MIEEHKELLEKEITRAATEALKVVDLNVEHIDWLASNMEESEFIEMANKAVSLCESVCTIADEAYENHLRAVGEK